LCGPFEGHGSSFVFSGKRASLKSELRVANADSETVAIHGSFDQFFTLEYCELCKSFPGHFTAPLWKHAGASCIPEPQMPRYIPRPTKSRSLSRSRFIVNSMFIRLQLAPAFYFGPVVVLRKAMKVFRGQLPSGSALPQ
jgi:hypothetical protein